ncbi:MAG TPA: hypothetical protein VKP59_04375, partial [Candidatus Thermoplasmatota archaeon]|nr:hypothetical protein [Candidatus Thermoplasmatota archaeon]
MKKSMFLSSKGYQSRMQIIFVLIIVFCLLSPLGIIVNASSHSVNFNDDLSFDSSPFDNVADGCFSGFWKSTTHNMNGILNGTISFGRSDTIGNIK